jgi:hypothetical protein
MVLAPIGCSFFNITDGATTPACSNDTAALSGRGSYMLDWLESPDLRRSCHAGLNKSEQRHTLAQVICTFRHGRIGERSAGRRSSSEPRA